jgi:hypothetical protein
MLGVGTAQKNENRAYFVVCRSEKLQAIRKRYNLPEQDFHVTLGFKFKDVFGVRKNEVLKKTSKFVQLLGQEYLKRENFEFLRKIDNWNWGESESEIYQLNHFTNFQPLWAKDNLVKGNRFES